MTAIKHDTATGDEIDSVAGVTSWEPQGQFIVLHVDDSVYIWTIDSTQSISIK